MFLLGVEWLATILCLTGGLLIVYKNIYGFHLNLAGDVLFVIFGFLTGHYGVLTLSFCYGILNIMGIIWWRRDQ